MLVALRCTVGALQGALYSHKKKFDINKLGEEKMPFTTREGRDTNFYI
jgi:hypothetical protein